MSSVGSGIWFPRLLMKAVKVTKLLNHFFHSTSMNWVFTTCPALIKKRASNSEQVAWFLLSASLHSWGERQMKCKVERMVSEGISAAQDTDWEEEASCVGAKGGQERLLWGGIIWAERPEYWVEAIISWPCGLRRPSPFKISVSSVLRRAECSSSGCIKAHLCRPTSTFQAEASQVMKYRGLSGYKAAVGALESEPRVH